MSSTSDAKAPGTKQYVDYDEYVEFQIEKARSHIKATDIFTTLTMAATAFVGYLLLFVVCDQWILEGGFNEWTRGTLLTVVVATLGTLLVRRVVLPLIRRVHPLYAARMLERADPNLQSNLLNFVDVRQAEGVTTAPVVLRSMEKRAAVELSHVDVDEAIDRRPLLRVAYALLAVVVLSALYIVFSPKDPFTSVRRALLPASSVAVATETMISEVAPGDDQVPARTLLTVEADVRGRDADRVQILFTTADNKYVDQPVEMRRLDPDLPRFRGVLNGENGRGLLQSLTYSISAGDARTRPFHIDVIQPPSARVDEVHYVFPDYMKLSRRTSAGGDIDGWEGATVTIHATANLPIKSATVVLTDSENPHARGEEIPVQVSGDTKLSATWKLDFRSDGTFPRFYRVQVKTAKGEIDPEPAVHTLRIHPDQRPDVTLLFPTGSLVGDRSKAPNAIIPLMIHAVDPDFELRTITLKAERNGEELVSERLFETDELGQSFRGGFDWNLGKLKLQPRDMIQFWIEVRDNKQPVANRAVTPRLDLEIADQKKTAEQVQQELAAGKQQQADQLARAEPNKGDGREELPGQEPSDEQRAGDKPPERPEQAAQRPPEKSEAPPEKPAGNKSNTADPNDGGKEGDRPQSQPPASEYQKALEKLLKQNETEKQPEPPQDRTEKRPPEGSEKGAQQKKAGSDGKQETKPDQKKTGKSEAKSEEARSQDTNDNDGKGDPSQSKSKPDVKRNDKGNPPPSDAGKPGKKEREKESPDKSGAPNDDESRTPPNAPKADDGEKRDPDKPNGAEKEPQRDTLDKASQDQTKAAPKKDGDPSPEKGDKGTGEKTSDKPGEKGTGDKPSEKPGPGDKPDGEKARGSDPDKADEKTREGDETGSEKTPKKSTDPGSDGAGKKNDPASSGDADRGKPGPSKSPSTKEKPGEADGDSAKSGSDSKSPEKSKADSGGGGKEEPADESPDATKKQADGTEKGEATGSDEDESNAPKSSNVKRKPDSKPGKTQPSNSPPSGGENKPQDQRKPKEGPSGATDDAEDANRLPDGKEPTEQPGKTEDPLSEKAEKKPKRDAEQRPGEPPDAGNQKPQGPGRKQGQKSEQPQGGEEGESAASDQGTKGGNKEGPGDKSGKPGDSENSEGKPGNPGGKSNQGSKSKPSQDGNKSKEGPGEKSGPGEGKAEADGKGKPSGKPSESGSGKGSSDKPGTESASSEKTGGNSSRPGTASNNQNSSASQGGGVNAPPSGNSSTDNGGTTDGNEPGLRPRGAGESAPTAEEEEARLDYARKASNLILQRLKKQLERGEVDQKLLDEMGWKDMNDVRQFTKFLEDNLQNTGEDTSESARAKRLQFEELLKSLQMGSGTERRQGGGSPERRVQPTTVRNVPVPPEYRQQQENYTKRLAKQRGAGETKPAAAKPSK